MRCCRPACCLPLVLAACTTASPYYWGVDPVPVTSEGLSFQVFALPGRAEAHRVGFRKGLSREEVRAAGAAAMERATNCRVRPGSLKGDQAIVTARLDC